MTKINLCFVLSHLTQGGAERQTINLIKGLNPSKYNITLVIYHKSDIFYKEVYDLPIKLIQNSKTSSRFKIVRNLTNALFLRKYLTNNHFDIIHTLLFHAGFWVRLLAPSKYNNKIVYSIRNSLVDCPKKFLVFEKYFLSKSYVVTNSNKSKVQFLDYVNQKHSNKVFNIYNGFDIEKFMVNYRTNVTNKIVIGNVGRQSSQKNQIQILRQIYELRYKYSLEFYLIGEENFEKHDEIIRYVKDNNLEKIVCVLDSQYNIEKYYKKFDIFILSSLYEGCPNVLFEAMLSKCLCIVSDGANSDNFIVDGINGLVYDGSDEMLGEKIEQAIKLLNENKVDAILNNSCKYVNENFSMNSMVLKYENIYSLIIEN